MEGHDRPLSRRLVKLGWPMISNDSIHKPGPKSGVAIREQGSPGERQSLLICLRPNSWRLLSLQAADSGALQRAVQEVKNDRSSAWHPSEAIEVILRFLFTIKQWNCFYCSSPILIFGILYLCIYDTN